MDETITARQIQVSRIYQESGDPESAYICARIEGQIAYYEKKSAQNKKLYHMLSILSIVANALVPVLSVFLKTADGNEIIKLLITIISSFAAVTASMLVLFNAKELWNKYRSSASALTSLLHQYYTRTGVFEDVEGDAAFRLLARLAEERLDEEHRAWGESLKHTDDRKAP